MVEFWYSTPIEKVRATADPGGEALSIEEANARRAELDRVIREAELARSRFEFQLETDREVVVTDTECRTYTFTRRGPVVWFDAWTQQGETYHFGDVPDDVVEFLQTAGYRIIERE